MSVDTAALTTALKSNSSAVTAIFNQTNGIAQALNANINSYTQTSGLIDQRTNAINADLKSVQSQATQLQTYSTS